ncbi:UDP-N-acetylglucosamine 2-epimerase [Polaribacter atrinae]|uniref:UDP-N-acetylglucosamine 2-epimerase domain-containing protein n=1 Tax=Polaribacter atrinae TaxID=1333662 RepID=A0A176TDZ0_9FLAO|nr:UDP-N-acetylglucosamine 2-epimerase [Polaribacter atrinae]OAD46138.1 hypothetical protein LPB303_04275 [Polaribacter atrinae]
MVLKKIKKYIVKRLLGENIFLSNYFLKTKKEIISYVLSSIFFCEKNKEDSYNFLITSKAEIRIFTPLINYFLKEKKHKIFIIYLSNYFLNDNLTKKINNSENIFIVNSPIPIINSIKNKKSVNIICLDFVLFYKSHFKGVDFIRFLKSKKAKTTCIQHGGCQDDNIKGQITSTSDYQIVFGKIIYDELVFGGRKVKNTYLTGNPNHDKVSLQNNLSSSLKAKVINKRKIILVATCLHTEYNYKENPEVYYIDYITNIYKSIDFTNCFLIVKMHPQDSVNPNIYENVMKDLKLSLNNIQFIYPNDRVFSVYDYIKISDLVISRSSTVIEEALLLGKNIIAYDLFEDGPSIHYSKLEKYEQYKKIVETEINLKKAIEYFINKKVDYKKHKSDMVENFTYKLDGESLQRVVNALEDISKK